MRFSTLVACVALPLIAGGCASFPGTTYYLDDLKSAVPTGPAFTQALSREYAAFAEADRQQYDWFNSWHFAHKGLLASQGTVVSPEELQDWSFSDKAAAADLAASRERLMKILESNAPIRVPALTATAQVKFDCWVEEQDKGWQTDNIAACRKDFLEAVDVIERHIVKATPPAAPAAAASVASVQKRTDLYQVFFDTNQDKMTPDAEKAVDDVVKAAQAAGYPKITVVGYTDTVGSTQYNQRLSLRRAMAVRKALMTAGIPADKLVAEGRGKSDPLVATADGVAEPQNRRVSIQFTN